MSSLPLVSIITPSYQQAPYLEATINSVLSQDYPNLEYLVVDGASTDGSREIIEKYANKLAWWVSEPDSGQGEAINKGLSRAKGEIVAWLNSDDLYLPGAIRRALNALQANTETSFVYSNLLSIDAEGVVFNMITYDQYSLEDLLSFRIIGQPTVFMRRAVLDKVGHLDTSFNFLLDHHLWLRMIEVAPAKYFPDQVWAAARHHPLAKNVAQATAFGREAFRILEWAEAQPGMAPLIRGDRRRLYAGAHRLDARYLLDGGEAGKALKAYWRTFLASPGFALQRWYRIFFALLSLSGLDLLRPMVIPRRRKVKGYDVPLGVNLSRIGSLPISESLAKRPVLVTGPHRSGTTWVGKMLAEGARYAYVSEPLNVLHRVGVFRAPIRRWYTYICDDNQDQFLPAFDQTLDLDYHLWDEVRSLRSARDLMRLGRDWFIFTRGKLTNRTPLLKDPFAVFSAPWFARRLNCQVVIVVRHPAAFVSSLKRLHWPFDFDDLLQQPLLMRDWLEPFRPEMETAARSPDDLVLQGSLLWRVVYHVVEQYRQRYPDFQIFRHEDLSLQPQEWFTKLFQALGLPFEQRARQMVARSTSGERVLESSLRGEYSVFMDSRANLKNWQKHLSSDEISRIRDLTADVAPSYYADEDWA